MTATSKVTVHIESVCCWIRYIEPSEKRQCTKKYGSWVVSLNSFLWKQGRFWLVTSKCCHPLGLFSACHLDLSCVVYGVACLLQIQCHPPGSRCLPHMLRLAGENQENEDQGQSSPESMLPTSKTNAAGGAPNHRWLLALFSLKKKIPLYVWEKYMS